MPVKRTLDLRFRKFVLNFRGIVWNIFGRKHPRCLASMQLSATDETHVLCLHCTSAFPPKLCQKDFAANMCVRPEASLHKIAATTLNIITREYLCVMEECDLFTHNGLHQNHALNQEFAPRALFYTCTFVWGGGPCEDGSICPCGMLAHFIVKVFHQIWPV